MTRSGWTGRQQTRWCSRPAGCTPSGLRCWPRRGTSSPAPAYARDRVCLAGDAGAVFPPFTGSGVLRALANATSLAEALAAAPAVDDALRRWAQAQAQTAAQLIPAAESIERSAVFNMPDLTTMPAAAANGWLSAAHPGLPVTLPDA